MSTLGAILAWSAVQATAFALIGVVAYLIVRRRGPARAAFALAASLVLLAALFACSFCPWPKWTNLEPATALSLPPTLVSDEHRIEPEFAGAPSVDVSDSASHNSNVAMPKPATVKVNATPSPLAIRSTAVASSPQSPRAAPTATWSWPEIAAMAFLLGVVLWAARLARGFFAVGQYRRRARPIEDAAAIGVFAELERELGCSRAVGLRECDRLATPATVGWRRPVVLLPTDWRAWTPIELRAVLAHELAHVARGDFAAWALAQICLTVQFYHPLAHWLAHRLRLEHELAADSLGAAAAGGRDSYQASLARLALRADDRRLAWTARPFLSNRGTLSWRIQMLQSNKMESESASSRSGRAWPLAALAAAALVVAGLRGPARDFAPARATADDLVNKAAPRPIDLSYVPDDAIYVLAIRLADLFGSPEAGTLAEQLNNLSPLAGIGLKAEEIEEIKFVATEEEEQLALEFPRIVVRTTAPKDWDQVRKLAPEHASFRRVKFRQSVYFEMDLNEFRPRAWSWHAPDARTLVISTASDVERLIREGAAPGNPRWAKQWPRLANGPIVAACVTREIEKTLAIRDRYGLDGVAVRPFEELVGWLPEYDSVVLGARIDGALHIEVTGIPDSDSTPERVVTFKMPLDQWCGWRIRKAETDLNASSSSNNALLQSSLQLLKELTASATLKADDVEVTLESTSKQGVDGLRKLLVAGAEFATWRAAQVQSHSNMHRIGTALFNYENFHRHMPAPITLSANGVPRSWRVELLPHLGYHELYKEYRQDEPWDSEHNKKIMARIPKVYRDPTRPPGSVETAYFAITGDAAALFGTEPRTFARITDGPSSTVWLVESHRNIPWTKPEDIAFDPAKPLPELGGVFEGTLRMGFLDNRIEARRTPIEENLLRSYFTVAGGEAAR